MFDSVLAKTGAPQGNLAGLGLSLFVGGAVVTAALFWPSMKQPKRQQAVDVNFVTALEAAPQPNAAPPAPPPPPAAAAQTAEKKPAQKKKPIVVEHKSEPDPVPAQQTPSEPPKQEAPSAPGGVAGGVQGGVQGGVPGGVQGGIPGGVLGGVLGGTTAVPFGVGMTRPTQIAGSTPQYSREAIAARVEGKVLVRCVITTQGAIQDCKVIKGVPFLEAITLDALRTSRFTPVTYQGRPAAVQYLFTFNFKLP